MSHWQITVSVCGRAVLHLRPVGEAHGGPPPGVGFGAKNPVAGEKPLLVPNCPLLEALFWSP